MKTQFSITMLALALSSSLAYSQAPQELQADTQAPQEPQVAAAQPSAPAPLKADPQLLCGKLENGLSYMIRKTAEPKGRASLRLYVDTGSLNESPETKGISHFCEHMVFNGSRHFKRGELIPAMQRLGLGFGGDANAYTGLLQTVYMMDLPKLDEETRDFAFRVMRDFADGATFTDEAIDMERGIVISELKSRDSQAYRASMAFIAQMLGGTRVPDYMPIGLEEVIKNCPYETIRAYYHENYVPERMTVVFAGDIDPAQAKAWVEQYFGDMKAAPNPPRPEIGTPSHLGPDEKIIPNPESALTSMLISVVTPYEYKADTIENRIDEMPLQLALNMLNRRFARMSREADSPFNAADAGKSDLFRAGTHFAVTANAPKERWQQALTAAENELRRACEFGFYEDELEECVGALLAAVRNSHDGWPTVTCNSMANSLIESLSEQLTPTAPDEDLRAIMAGLERVTADPDICRRALAEAYKADCAKLTMMGDIPEDATEDSLRSAFEQARQVKLEAPEKRAELTFAYDRIGDPGAVVQQQLLEDIGTTTLTLSNGVRVNIKPMSERKNSILVRADVDGGRISLPPIPGLAQLTSKVLKDGAMEAHSLDDLRRLTMGRTVALDFALGEDRFTFSGETNNADLELQCKLLAASIMHPGYRPEGEMLLRRNIDAIYTRLETTPNGASGVGTAKALFGNDPRFTMPEKEELLAVTTADVKQAVDANLKEGAVEVTLVGDFKVDEVLPVVLRTFGAMPARRPEFSEPSDAQRTVIFRPWGQREFIRYNTELDKTIVSRVVYAGDGMDRKRGRRLGVLSSVAGDKVFDGIRAALGESYSPRVSLDLNEEYKDAAYFTVSSAGVKRNRVKVNSAIDLILTDLGKGNINRDEFDCVMEPLRARTEKALRNPSFWLGSLAQLQSDPEQLELIRGLKADIDSITLEEIQQLAREVFGSDKQDYLFTVPQDYDEKEPNQEPALTELPKSQADGATPAQEDGATPAQVDGATPAQVDESSPATPEPEAEPAASAAPPQPTDEAAQPAQAEPQPGESPATAAPAPTTQPAPAAQPAPTTQEAPAAEPAPQPAAAQPAAVAQDFSPYTIILTESASKDPAWVRVAHTLAAKHVKKNSTWLSFLS